jgi:hypothetical protein
MKKLLSLLSVLTISGTAVPTTIAASPYQKEETIKNSDINYQQPENKTFSSYLEKNNNFYWWETISALWEIGIKNIKEYKDYLVEKLEDIKNYLLSNFDEEKLMTLENKIDSDFIQEKVLNLKKNFNIKNNGDEVDIYFSISHREMTFPMVFKYNHWNSSYHMIDINIEKINPSEYKYIQFIPRHNNDSIHTYVSWGNDRFYGKTINEALNEKSYELKYFIKNTKVENNDDSIKKNLNINLQHGSYKDGLAWIDVDQSMGLASYYDTNDKAFHLQILSGQYVGPKWSFSGGGSSIGIGAYVILSK